MLGALPNWLVGIIYQDFKKGKVGGMLSGIKMKGDDSWHHSLEK